MVRMCSVISLDAKLLVPFLDRLNDPAVLGTGGRAGLLVFGNLHLRLFEQEPDH